MQGHANCVVDVVVIVVVYVVVNAVGIVDFDVALVILDVVATTPTSNSNIIGCVSILISVLRFYNQYKFSDNADLVYVLQILNNIKL